MVPTLARGVVFVVACFAALGGGAAILIAATVGACAAVGVLLYGVAHLFVYLFGISFRWGLVSACWLLFLGPIVGVLIHDLRMIHKLALLEALAPKEP